MKTHTGRKQLKYFVETANFSLFFFLSLATLVAPPLPPFSSTNGSPVAIKSVLGSHWFSFGTGVGLSGINKSVIINISLRTATLKSGSVTKVTTVTQSAPTGPAVYPLGLFTQR